MLLGVLLLTGWACAALLIGLAAGVTRTDLLLVVPATVMVAALVSLGGALLGARLLAQTLTTASASLLALVTWGLLPGTVMTVSAAVVAVTALSFLRPTGRRASGPHRA